MVLLIYLEITFWQNNWNFHFPSWLYHQARFAAVLKQLQLVYFCQEEDRNKLICFGRKFQSQILCWKELFCLYVWFKNICYSKGSGASSINDLGNKFIKYEFLFKYDIDVFKIRLSNLYLFKNIFNYCKCSISTRW